MRSTTPLGGSSLQSVGETKPSVKNRNENHNQIKTLKLNEVIAPPKRVGAPGLDSLKPPPGLSLELSLDRYTKQANAATSKP